MPKKRSKKPDDTRLREFQTWLTDLMSASSIRTYLRAVKFALRNYPDDPTKLLSRKDLTNSSRNTYRAALRMWAKFIGNNEMEEYLKSLEMRRVMKNALREEHRTRQKHDVQPFSSEEEKRIYGVLKEWRDDMTRPRWQWPAISMMFNLGLRAGADLAWLARKDVESARKSGTSLVIVTKGSKERELPAVLVTEEIQCLLDIEDEWEILADLIVQDRKHGDAYARVRNAYERIRRCVKTLAEDAGIDPDEVHTHRFRHNAAWRLYRLTSDIRMVQKFLGHESYNTTLGYLGKNQTEEMGEKLLAAKKALEEEME